jgi:putative transposase
MAELFKEKYRIQSARCPNWDYSSDGAYFITICTDRWEPFFGKIENQRVILSGAGQTAEQFWKELPSHFPFIQMDVFVIMPNHTHGILIIDKMKLHPPLSLLQADPGGNRSTEAQKYYNNKKSELMGKISPKKGTISTIIRSYKSACTNEINKTDPGLNFKWQSRFHDHIIRDKQSHQYIREYILSNPAKWNDDMFFR